MHSRNYLNTLLNIEHISSIIITNKLNILTRLLNNKKTGNIILQMLEKANYSCFITDIHDLTSIICIALIKMTTIRRYPKVFEPIEERVLQELIEKVCGTWSHLKEILMPLKMTYMMRLLIC